MNAIIKSNVYYRYQWLNVGSKLLQKPSTCNSSFGNYGVRNH